MATNETPNHQDNCLMCAVRALTSGTPEVVWHPETEGQTISGVLLRQGEIPDSRFGPLPYVDLWTGGATRVRVPIAARNLRHALEAQEAEVGDTVTIWYEGKAPAPIGRPMRLFRVTVQRGH